MTGAGRLVISMLEAIKTHTIGRYMLPTENPRANLNHTKMSHDIVN